MSENSLYIGNNQLTDKEPEVNGQFTTLDGEEYYVIRNYNSMNPFFISLASDSDHWMYISSTGGVTAGRKNPDSSLFPYYTDDKIHETSEITGSKTILHVLSDGKRFLWEPFSNRYAGIYPIERNIYKSIHGNKLIFEEKNLNFGLSFSYAWMNSDKFGWIKKSRILNESGISVEVHLMDGVQNILPFGVDRVTQNNFSTLVDAYKKSELIKDVQLALYRMESIPVDKAEPSEALRVTTVWSTGLDKPSFLLSSRQLDRFRSGHNLSEENEAKGIKGAFFAESRFELKAGARKEWYMVAELNQDSVRVNNLVHFIQSTRNLSERLEEDIARGTEALRSIVAEADGIQQSADKFTSARHFSNVLFNVMRGGIFSEGYTIKAQDFIKHLNHFNPALCRKLATFLDQLPANITYTSLGAQVETRNNSDLYRLYLEYLPLTFSRRHGDPSRPWNLFSINLKDAQGNKLLFYQGNWRDIFQNWEALSLSYPGYISGIIAKFVNATTADGYNPYRVTRDGIDWEIPEPDNPWSNIGYWGDHQVIYLLKLMEVSDQYFPGRLQSWLNTELFAYANVPYRIKPYQEVLQDPHNSIKLDVDLNVQIEQQVKSYGADAKLMMSADGEVIKVTFTEKLLAPLLAKLSNFIPEAGIWMNTLRPEWNDANNALVGYGVSMVTLYYIRRFLTFIEKLYKSSGLESYRVSEEIATFLKDIHSTFYANVHWLESGFDDTQRKLVLDHLGKAGTNYREKVYKGLSLNKTELTRKDLLEFISLSLRFVDQSIAANKREDHMYHAYNLIHINSDTISVAHLYEMLEGQVSVLSSGKLNATETLEVLDAMRSSALYREDQESYILYPNKRLPLFLEKNNISSEEISRSPVLQQLVTSGNQGILNADEKGQYHFNGDFRNASVLGQALKDLKNKSVLSFSEEEYQEVLDLYESIFHHHSFTGRSGTFYKYEGLGCIYWHMVSKLLLTIGENYKRFAAEGAPEDLLNRIARHYGQVKKGIGSHKSPGEYGSFPFDPYSHTPMMAGVQQPGMTGQVKEDIISRFFELGIVVKDGQLTVHPMILRKDEFIEGESKGINHPHMAFTMCKVPFLYLLDQEEGIDISGEGKTRRISEYTLSKADSLSIMNRDGRIEKITVHLNPEHLI